MNEYAGRTNATFMADEIPYGSVGIYGKNR